MQKRSTAFPDSSTFYNHGAFLRCVGGTWSVLTKNARRTLIRDILYALNTIESEDRPVTPGTPNQLISAAVVLHELAC